MAKVSVTLELELPAYELRELYVMEGEEPEEESIVDMVSSIINAEDYELTHGWSYEVKEYKELGVEDWKEEEE